MKEFDLREYLDKYKNTKVDFFRFPGNYGDSLIWHGTMKLLSELNIRVNYVNLISKKKNEILLIDGGGNLVDYYTDVRDFLTTKSALYSKIIILPHTIFGEKQIRVLNNLRSDTIIFCREKVSADFMAKHTKRGMVYLWHDCAFYNSLENNEVVERTGVLNVFRLDQESILPIKPDLIIRLESTITPKENNPL